MASKVRYQQGAAPTPTVKGKRPKTPKGPTFKHKNASVDPELNAPR